METKEHTGSESRDGEGEGLGGELVFKSRPEGDEKMSHVDG